MRVCFLCTVSKTNIQSEICLFWRFLSPGARLRRERERERVTVGFHEYVDIGVCVCVCVCVCAAVLL